MLDVAVDAAPSVASGPNAVRCTSSLAPVLLVVGGWKWSAYTCDVVSWELPTGRWQLAAPLPEARAAAGAAVIDGRVHVIGGVNGSESLSSVVVYDVTTGSWMTGPSMNTARSRGGAVALGGVLYAAGGEDAAGSVLSSAEALDPREGFWRSIPSMSTGRYGVGVAALEGLLYAVGGHDDRHLNTVERYDPSTNKWEPVESMLERRCAMAVGVVGDTLYVVGGHDGSNSLSSMERYRAGSGWESAPSVPWPPAAAVALGGHLYAVSRRDRRSAFVAAVAQFDPRSAAWHELPHVMPAVPSLAAVVAFDWPQPQQPPQPPSPP